MSVAARRYSEQHNSGGSETAAVKLKRANTRAPQSILADFIEMEPGSLGKWLAAAKDAGMLDIALSLAKNHRQTPKRSRAQRAICSEAAVIRNCLRTVRIAMDGWMPATVTR
jgi:hypothetical protein